MSQRWAAKFQRLASAPPRRIEATRQREAVRWESFRRFDHCAADTESAPELFGISTSAVTLRLLSSRIVCRCPKDGHEPFVFSPEWTRP